jgi:hypothetical protein
MMPPEMDAVDRHHDRRAGKVRYASFCTATCNATPRIRDREAGSDAAAPGDRPLVLAAAAVAFPGTCCG